MKFISSAPTKTRDIVIPVTTRPTIADDLRWWGINVQPIIRRLGPTARLDADWNWENIVSRSAWLGLWQEPQAYSILAYSNSANRQILCGLVYLACRYKHLPDNRRRATFLWYLSTAPHSVMQNYFPANQIPRLVGQIGVDIGVVESINRGWQGRVGTHADPSGGEPLHRFYVDTCGMRPLAPTVKLPTFGRNLFISNDGRYCYFEQEEAQNFINRLTAFRPQE